jgi:hypothetical protein
MFIIHHLRSEVKAIRVCLKGLLAFFLPLFEPAT